MVGGEESGDGDEVLKLEMIRAALEDVEIEDGEKRVLARGTVVQCRFELCRWP
jgi:hypothetical protein